MQELDNEGAKESGTPIKSFFSSEEVLLLARTACLKDSIVINNRDLVNQYFMNRNDNLHPASGEFFLISKT